MTDSEPGVETVTEGMYTRAFIFDHMLFLTGFVLILIGWIGVMYLPFESIVWAGMVAVILFGIFLWSVSNAIESRGICHRILADSISGPSWVLNDIDTEEFVDGPVEVEVVNIDD